MAKIYGVEIKTYKGFMGMDNMAFTANLYMDDSKIGTVSNEGYGGSNNIVFNTEESEKAFRTRVKQYFDKYPHQFASADWFINELLELQEFERLFKEESKKGRGILMVMRYNQRVGKFDPRKDVLVALDNIREIPLLLKKYEPKEHQIYKELSDFVIE